MEAADIIIELHDKIIKEQDGTGKWQTRRRKYYIITWWDEKNVKHTTEPLSSLSYVRWRCAMIGANPDDVPIVDLRETV